MITVSIDEATKFLEQATRNWENFEIDTDDLQDVAFALSYFLRERFEDMYNPAADEAAVERVAEAIGYKLCELEGDTLAHGLTLDEWRGLARAAITAYKGGSDAD